MLERERTETVRSLSLSLSSKPPGERQRVSRRKEGPEACSGTLTPKRAAEGLGPRLAPTGRPVLSLTTPLWLERLNIYLPFLLFEHFHVTACDFLRSLRSL